MRHRVHAGPVHSLDDPLHSSSDIPPTQPNPSYLSPYDCVSYLVICGYCKVPSLSKFQAGENIQRPSRSAGRPTLMKTLLYTAPEHRM